VGEAQDRGEGRFRRVHKEIEVRVGLRQKNIEGCDD